jgi:hypothetical protein
MVYINQEVFMSHAFTRLVAAVTAAIPLAMFASSASAQEVTLKVHHFLPAGS